MKLNKLEIIGLTFINGLQTAEIIEDLKKEDEEQNNENKTEKEEIVEEGRIDTVEIKKITPKEMSEILEDLKNKVLGGKSKNE